jgi:aspartate/methionine/tyrosine aminotransferase
MVSSSRSEIASFIAMDVLAKANALEAEGNSILHLEVGEPGVSAPESVLEAAHAALRAGRLGYTEALGLKSLRARIARHYGQAYGLDLDPERVVVTTGSSAGFILAFLALFDVGASVAIAEPGYPAYRNILKALSLTPVSIRVGPKTRWSISAEAISAAQSQTSLGGVLIASPANPTGTVIEPSALAEIASICDQQSLSLISDEIYHGLTFGVEAGCALSNTDRAIIINSFSKYYCMTGWRIGWMVVPTDLVRVVERLAQNLFISPPTISQIAAEAAFDATDEYNGLCDVYAANRRILTGALENCGLGKIAPADGAFYLYADISAHSIDSEQFASQMLTEIGVASTPGVDFDQTNGHSYLRFSYAADPAVIAQAAERLKRWLA